MTSADETIVDTGATFDSHVSYIHHHHHLPPFVGHPTCAFLPAARSRLPPLAVGRPRTRHVRAWTLPSDSLTTTPTIFRRCRDSAGQHRSLCDSRNHLPSDASRLAHHLHHRHHHHLVYSHLLEFNSSPLACSPQLRIDALCPPSLDVSISSARPTSFSTSLARRHRSRVVCDARSDANHSDRCASCARRHHLSIIHLQLPPLPLYNRRASRTYRQSTRGASPPLIASRHQSLDPHTTQTTHQPRHRHHHHPPTPTHPPAA